MSSQKPSISGLSCLIVEVSITTFPEWIVPLDLLLKQKKHHITAQDARGWFHHCCYPSYQEMMSL
jgi:hypothetical protein